jgi:hypothetical protein
MTFAVSREAIVVRAGLPCPLRVGRRASDNVKARFGADTGPTRGCPRRRAIRPERALINVPAEHRDGEDCDHSKASPGTAGVRQERPLAAGLSN